MQEDEDRKGEVRDERKKALFTYFVSTMCAFSAIIALISASTARFKMSLFTDPIPLGCEKGASK